MDLNDHISSLVAARKMAQMSPDPSTKVGCIITYNRAVIGVGYNRFPDGVLNTNERYNDRPLKYMLVSHAEFNAVGQMVKSGINDFSKTVVYIYGLPPCSDCLKLFRVLNINEIYYYRDASSEALERWDNNIGAEILLNETSLNVTDLTTPEITQVLNGDN